MDKKELLNNLQKCGHFLHCQKGKSLGQYRILLILKKEGVIPQKELQQILRIQSGSISEILSKMESNELIYRTKDKNDKRKALVGLSLKGEEYIKKLINDYEYENQNLFNCLSDEECDNLNNLLIKLYSYWIGDDLDA